MNKIQRNFTLKYEPNNSNKQKLIQNNNDSTKIDNILRIQANFYSARECWYWVYFHISTNL